MNELSLYQRDNLLMRFLAFLNEHSISYCVLSNLSNTNPEYDLDVDISIAQNDTAAVAKLIREFSHSNDLLVIFDIWSGTHSRAYTLVKRGSAARVVLKLDIMVGYASFRTGELLRHEEIARDRVFNGSFWGLSETSELAYLSVRHFIKSDDRAYRIERINFLREKVSLEISREAFPPVILEAITSATSGSPKTADRAIQLKLKNYGKARMGFIGRAAAAISEIRRAVHRVSRPVGCTIAFLGPDGAGKSTLIKALRTRMAPVFHGSTSFYWRPRLLPSPGRLRFWNPSLEKEENPDPHNVIPHGKVASLARLLYFSLDYILGYFVLVHPRTICKDLVIFDRFLNDIRIDQLRYRMNVPELMLRFVERFVPKPDIIFALYGPPEVLHARKPELSIEETARQVALLRQMAEENRHFTLVSVDNGVEKIVDEIIETIMLSCAEAGQENRFWT
ncbi:hypothetical protein U5903_22275 [Cereibacter johrii]|uniref:hypothetical protein n=1 Tax=Cereibacter johrii TaxID=445629 RepID=UPI002B21A054|nr:hypothetical protein [Cereibacter johrii]MEA5163507.1 hypothetical protein [Cereibacter johrii]